MNLSSMKALLRPIWRALDSVVTTGVWHSTDASEEIDRGQISLRSGENLDGVPRLQQYGFRSRPKPGAELVCVRRGAKADGHLVIVVDDRRFTLSGMQDGEVAIFDDQGSSVWLKRGGEIAIKAAGGVKIDGDVEITGNLKASGQVEDFKGTLDAFRLKYNPHIHSAPGGATGPPSPQA